MALLANQAKGALCFALFKLMLDRLDDQLSSEL